MTGLDIEELAHLVGRQPVGLDRRPVVDPGRHLRGRVAVPRMSRLDVDAGGNTADGLVKSSGDPHAGRGDVGVNAVRGEVPADAQENPRPLTSLGGCGGR